MTAAGDWQGDYSEGVDNTATPDSCRLDNGVSNNQPYVDQPSLREETPLAIRASVPWVVCGIDGYTHDQCINCAIYGGY